MPEPTAADAIRALAAGRELDAEVATRVTGWAALRSEFVRGVACPGGDFLFGAPPAGPRTVIPYYSTDIAAAWDALEHVSLKGTWRYRLTSSGNEYYCEIATERLGCAAVRAETMPLAICRAALLAAAGKGE